MEDLKKIQEFFSKPLEENIFKKGDKVTYLNYPAEITSVEDRFGKIYLSVSYDKGEGKTKARGILSTDGSVKPLKEDQDINDPVMMKLRADKDKLAKMRAANAGDDGNDAIFRKARENVKKLEALKQKRAQIMRDMEQEAEIEGGPIADKYGDMLNKLDKAIAMLSGQGKGDEYMSKDEIERRASMIGDYTSKTNAMFGLEENEDPIDTITMDIPLFLRMLEYSREDASQDMDLHDVTEKANKLGKERGILSMDDYEEIVGAAEEIDEAELTEAYVPSNIKEFAKRKGVSRLVNTVAGWAEKVGARINGGTAIGKNYNTLILDMGYQTADIYINCEEETVELYDEPVRSFADFKRVFMEEETRKQIEHDEETLRREQGLEERIAEALDKINEELCPAGKAYIKARQAAGEKSSAYLSGRAVRVCKGQMSGRSKKK